jgi:hypothetical protein
MSRRLSLGWHLALLALLAVCAFGIWMLPVLLAGYPYALPFFVPAAKEFAASGVVGQVEPLVVLIFRALHPFIAWNDVTGWTAVSAAGMALSLLPLWWSVRRLSGSAEAWLTVVIFSFLPMFWNEAITSPEYPFAFFFLFLGCALFLELFPRHRFLAALAFGLCFGAVFDSSHAFITFLPWMAAAFLWHERRRWKSAAVALGIFAASLFVSVVLPFLPNALRPSLTPLQRLEAFLPSPAAHGTGLGHLYPDDYTYLFLREPFEQQLLAKNGQESFLVRQQDMFAEAIFDVGNLSVLDKLVNGFWLFLNVLPQPFVQDFTGGAFLWLFILPGIVVLWQRRRFLLCSIAGLWLSMEVILRFVLHYARPHLLDVGWSLAFFAAVGIAAVSGALHERWKRVPSAAFAVFLALLTAAQLVQANRVLLARNYARSAVPAAYAAARTLDALPRSAVVAHPRGDALFFFSNRADVTVAPETLDLLVSEHKNIRDPFRYYKVTHILGYDAGTTKNILAADPSIKAIALPEPEAPVPLTPLIRYLLNLVH